MTLKRDDDQYFPNFILESIWEVWQRYWQSLEFQKMFAQGSMNRMSETGGEGV